MNWSIVRMTKIIKKPEQVSSREVKSTELEDVNLHGGFKNFLFSHCESTEDKIATVKTVQLVDNERFETAFKTLMKR